MPDLPGPETPIPGESDAPPETVRDADLPPAEPMTNAPIPIAEDGPGVGLTRANDEPDAEAGGRDL